MHYLNHIMLYHFPIQDHNLKRSTTLMYLEATFRELNIVT